MIPHEDMLLLPLVVLVLWTILISFWMFYTRVGAMTAQKMDANKGRHTKDIEAKMPSKVRAVADNYNNLGELPILFYALSLAIFAMGHVDMIQVYLAWIFVGSRILHSLIQISYNQVMHRFGVFVIGLLSLTAMAVREIVTLI